MALGSYGSQMGFVGAGGKRFMSSALAKASQPGGYQITTNYGAGGNPNYRGPRVGTGYGQAFAANKARQARIESMYDEMLKTTTREGAFYKSNLAQIEQAKVKGVGTETQNLISSGMYGTTTASGVGRQWEADVGMPARIKLEDVMEQRRLGIQQQRAGFVERITDSYPDYSQMFSALAR